MIRHPNQCTAIDGYAVRRVNPEAVGAASAANAADAEDNAAAEAAAPAIIDKFGSKFAVLGSNSMKTTGRIQDLAPRWPG